MLTSEAAASVVLLPASNGCGVHLGLEIFSGEQASMVGRQRSSLLNGGNGTNGCDRLIRDVDRARAWAESLPSGAGQGAAFAKIAASTAELDPKGTAEWLNNLPPGSARDQAILPFSEAVRKEDPEAAITWALSISDPITRQDQLARMAGWWNGVDAKALRAWLNADAQLTPEEKRHLLAQ